MTEIQLPEAPETPRAGILARLMPLLTLVIAFSAIGLAIWEGLENRRHNRLTVLPRIGAEIDAGRNGDEEYVRLAMESTGLGPAVLTAFRIYFDGVVQDTGGTFGTAPWAAVIDALSSDSSITMNAQAFGEGYYLPAGREVVIFEATRPRSTRGDSAIALVGILDRLAVQVCYCSVYGSDCGEIPLTTSEEPLEPCPAP